MHRIQAPSEELLRSLVDLSSVFELTNEPLRIDTPASLHIMLEMYAPWYTQWGTDGRSKSHTSLITELVEGEAELWLIESAGVTYILRSIRTATLYVTTSRPDPTPQAPNRKKKLWLREYHREGGVLVPRRYHNSMSEKLLECEFAMPTRGALRALAQELCITPDPLYTEPPHLIAMSNFENVVEFRDDMVASPRDQVIPDIDARNTPRYPGILTRNQLFHFKWHMPEEYFNPAGYKEPDKEHYFFWEDVVQVST